MPTKQESRRKDPVEGTAPARAEPPIEAPSVEPAVERRTAFSGQYLTFFLGGEEYGAAILQVKEIIEFDTLTRVPTTPPWVRGVLNLRGSVVPVIDLAVKIGLDETVVTSRTCVVIVEVELGGDSSVMGVMVDSVSQVVTFDKKDIEPPPAFGTRIHADYLIGMGRSGEKFVLLVDIDRVLSVEDLMTAAVAQAEVAARQEDGGDRQASDSEEIHSP